MIDINEYIKQSLDFRQIHLNLNSQCIEIGGNSTNFRGILAYHLGTTIPKGHKIHLCHACYNDKCSNVFHLYWGTAFENSKDSINNGRISPWDAVVRKYGLEEAKRMNRKNGIANRASEVGKIGGSKLKKESHKNKISLSLTGKIRYTNGKVNVTLNKEDNPPEGYWRGLSKTPK